MLKSILAINAIVGTATLAIGCYIGWKTTMRILDSVNDRVNAGKTTNNVVKNG